MAVTQQTATVTEVRTLVITLAVGGAFAIAAAFAYGWQSIDQQTAQARLQLGAIRSSDIVEIPSQ